VWPELKYHSGWLHDGKALATYGIDQGATLDMTWPLLGGGPTPGALVPDTGPATSHAAAPTMLPSDENDAVDLGPRSRSVSPSITTADDNADEEWASARAACKPKVTFVNQRAVHEPDATDSRTTVETLGHALPRNMAACNVESLEGEGAADAFSHSLDALNAAREAPLLDIPAVNDANALDASLASESAGVFMMSPYLLCTPTAACRTCTHRRQIGHPHFLIGHPHFFLGAKARDRVKHRARSRYEIARVCAHVYFCEHQRRMRYYMLEVRLMLIVGQELTRSLSVHPHRTRPAMPWTASCNQYAYDRRTRLCVLPY
jgi:hypothetical protein